MGTFSDAIANIASAKALTSEALYIYGFVFGYQSRTKPSDKNLSSWFQTCEYDGRSLGEVTSDGTLGADMVLFFNHNCSLLRLQIPKDTPDSANYYARLYSSDAANDGWMLSKLIAFIKIACEQNEFLIGRAELARPMLRFDSIENGNYGFRLGEGMAPLPESPEKN
jgi:hypothetical protein